MSTQKNVFVFVPEVDAVKAVGWQTPITGIMAVAVKREEVATPAPLIAAEVAGGRVLMDDVDLTALVAEAKNNGLNNGIAKSNTQLRKQFTADCQAYGLRVSQHTQAAMAKQKADKEKPEAATAKAAKTKPAPSTENAAV